MSPALIALISEGWITHLATNGAGIIHDWELAYQGKTSEDVREKMLKTDNSEYGMKQVFFINLALVVGAYEGLGYGESDWQNDLSMEGLHIPEVSLLKR